MLPRICEDVAWSTGGFGTTSKKGLNETNGHGLSTRLSPGKEELAARGMRRFRRPFDSSKRGASGSEPTAVPLVNTLVLAQGQDNEFWQIKPSASDAGGRCKLWRI